MKMKSRRDFEQGSIAPIVAMGGVALALLSVGGFGTARMVTARMVTQHTSDALALAAAQGGGSVPAMNAARHVALLNLRQVPQLGARCGEEPERFVCGALTTSELSLPPLLFGVERKQITARAHAYVRQMVVGNLTRSSGTQNLVLVLDYSGSMYASYGTMADSVRDLMNADLTLNYGAVFFSTEVLASVEIGPQSNQEIITQLDKLQPMGVTYTGKALDRAGEILANASSGSGGYVVLISDGMPSDYPEAQAAAQKLWVAGHTIITIHITSGYGDYGADIMKSLCGTPKSQEDADYYYPLTEPAQLATSLAASIARITCPIPPLPAGMVDLDPRLQVTLRQPGVGLGNALPEIPATADFTAFTNRMGYRYDPVARQLFLTDAACQDAADNGRELVIRYNRAKLVPSGTTTVWPSGM